jgi:hypothetical protein
MQDHELVSNLCIREEENGCQEQRGSRTALDSCRLSAETAKKTADTIPKSIHNKMLMDS